MSKKGSSKKRESQKRKNTQANEPSHVTTENVFEDLGFTLVESLLLKFRTDLHSLVLQQVKRQGYDRRQLERILDEPQSRISELMTGKISKMSLDRLVRYLFRLGAEPTQHKEESGIRLVSSDRSHARTSARRAAG